MDVVAHGLWGGALFYRHGRKQFLAGALLGMAPDLLSFGVFHLTQPGWLVERLLGNISGPPALASLPPYVFHSYNVTHSMIVWAAGFALLWALIKKPPWLLAAWGCISFAIFPPMSRDISPRRFYGLCRRRSSTESLGQRLG